MEVFSATCRKSEGSDGNFPSIGCVRDVVVSEVDRNSMASLNVGL